MIKANYKHTQILNLLYLYRQHIPNPFHERPLTDRFHLFFYPKNCSYLSTLIPVLFSLNSNRVFPLVETYFLYFTYWSVPSFKKWYRLNGGHKSVLFHINPLKYNILLKRLFIFLPTLHVFLNGKCFLFRVQYYTQSNMFIFVTKYSSLLEPFKSDFVARSFE